MPVRIEHASQLGADARAVAPTRPAAISSHKRERTERREIFKNGPAAGRAKTFTSDPLVAGFDQLMHNCGGGGEGDWNFGGPPNPNAFIQIGNMTLELQCDRVRFAPAGYEDSQDIVSKQGISFRFMKNGSTEVGAFQAGSANADIAIVDNNPVEVRFYDRADYDFVLDQIARNAVLNLSMIDQDVTYGIFSLKGSGAAVRSLRAACSSSGLKPTFGTLGFARR
jgi:hypothetical protein